MNCLEIIVKFGIISNIGTLFFTSNTIFEVFTTGWYDIKGFFPSWEHKDWRERPDTIDVAAVRRKLADKIKILQKVEEALVREVEESNAR